MSEAHKQPVLATDKLEENINGDHVLTTPESIAQLAAKIAQKDNVVSFGEWKTAINDEPVIANLTEIAQNVVTTLNKFLGEQAAAVKLKVGLVPANGEGPINRRPGYAAGLLIDAATATEVKTTVLETLNTMIPYKDDKIEMSEDGSINVNAERLHMIVSKLEKQKREQQASAAAR